jgi:hypothetical protein
MGVLFPRGILFFEVFSALGFQRIEIPEIDVVALGVPGAQLSDRFFLEGIQRNSMMS